MAFLNTEILSNPFNWAIVLLMALLGLALISILTPSDS